MKITAVFLLLLALAGCAGKSDCIGEPYFKVPVCLPSVIN